MSTQQWFWSEGDSKWQDDRWVRFVLFKLFNISVFFCFETMNDELHMKKKGSKRLRVMLKCGEKTYLGKDFTQNLTKSKKKKAINSHKGLGATKSNRWIRLGSTQLEKYNSLLVEILFPS